MQESCNLQGERKLFAVWFYSRPVQLSAVSQCDLPQVPVHHRIVLSQEQHPLTRDLEVPALSALLLLLIQCSCSSSWKKHNSPFLRFKGPTSFFRSVFFLPISRRHFHPTLSASATLSKTYETVSLFISPRSN